MDVVTVKSRDDTEKVVAHIHVSRYIGVNESTCVLHELTIPVKGFMKLSSTLHYDKFYLLCG